MKVFSIKHSMVIGVALLSLASCKKEDALNVTSLTGLGGDSWTQGAIDKWIYDSLTVPYNITNKYKWDQFELDLGHTVAPPMEQLVVPLLSSIKKIWSAPYVAEAGVTFFNKYSPKTLVMLGSYQYLANGSILLGNAEGGAKVRLFGVNYFRLKGMTGYTPSTDSNFAKTFFYKTMHHEFAHILHQNILYPQEYKTITTGYYQYGNWINVSDADERRDGFITAYASSGFDDDFAEMVSVMLTEGKSGFDKIVAAIPAGTSTYGTTQAQAQARLRKKETIIVAYYKNAWNIDFYSLQTKCRDALTTLF
jgi:substrate import-associated zinc metallohydrolase lipoprotein